MTIAEKIWRVPVYLPYLQPELTDTAVSEAEEKIGFTLPEEYLELLRVQNGGYIRLSLPEKVHSAIAGIGPHFPSLTDFDWEEAEDWVSFELDGLVPFDGDGQWHLCLDYRQDAEQPAVTYIEIDPELEERIADSFAGYLELLHFDVANEQVVEAADIEALVAQLASKLGVTFETQDASTHGYPVHRAALGGPGNPQWLWLSPNEVPRGFVRPNHRRYEELKDRMPGTALRYPEISASSSLLKVTDSVRARVLQACKELKLAIQPLRNLLGSS